MTRQIEIQIALAVDIDGNWNATGWSSDNQDRDKSFAMDIATEAMNKDYKKYWITAIVEVPEENIVEGNAECQ